MCIIVTEDNMKNPQFTEMLNLLTELKTLKIDNVKISLGRLQVIYEQLRQFSSFCLTEKEIFVFNFLWGNII